MAGPHPSVDDGPSSVASLAGSRFRAGPSIFTDARPSVVGRARAFRDGLSTDSRAARERLDGRLCDGLSVSVTDPRFL